MFDPLLSAGLQWYWKADFFKELSDEAIAAHVKHGAAMPTMLSTMHLYPVNGAAQPREEQRDAVGVSRREVGAGDRGRRSGSGQQRKDHGLGARLLDAAPSALGAAAPT